MTVREAASFLGRSPAFVRSLIAEGHVSYRNIRGRFYITRDDLDVWLGAAPEPVKTPFVLRPF